MIGINNDMISSESDLFRAVEKYKVGDEVVLKVVRRSDWQQQDEENSVNGYGGKDYVANRMKGKISSGDVSGTTITSPPSAKTKSPFEEDGDGDEGGGDSSGSKSIIKQSQQQQQQQKNQQQGSQSYAPEFIVVELKVKLASANEALGSSS